MTETLRNETEKEAQEEAPRAEERKERPEETLRSVGSRFKLFTHDVAVKLKLLEPNEGERSEGEEALKKAEADFAEATFQAKEELEAISAAAEAEGDAFRADKRNTESLIKDIGAERKTYLSKVRKQLMADISDAIASGSFTEKQVNKEIKRLEKVLEAEPELPEEEFTKRAKQGLFGGSEAKKIYSSEKIKREGKKVEDRIKELSLSPEERAVIESRKRRDKALRAMENGLAGSSMDLYADVKVLPRKAKRMAEDLFARYPKIKEASFGRMVKQRSVIFTDQHIGLMYDFLNASRAYELALMKKTQREEEEAFNVPTAGDLPENIEETRAGVDNAA